MSGLEKIQEICSQPKGLRTLEQIEFLYTVLKPIKVFKNLLKYSTRSAFSEVCQLLMSESCKANEYVFRYGDVGTRYYIILEGKVSMQVPTSPNRPFVEIMVYEKHSGFGEIALEAYKTRGASAFCLTPCTFLSIDKKDYLRHMQSFLSENKQQIVSFLSKLPFFNQMSRILLSKLTYNIHEVLYKKNQFIFKEGENPSHVFIIQSGEVELCKMLPRERSPIRTLRQTTKYTSCPATILTEGHLIGESAALNNLPHKFSCNVLSDTAILFQIPVKDFFARINSEDLVKFLQQQCLKQSEKMQEWENVRTGLEKVFESKENDSGTPERTREVVKKCRLRACVSERKVCTRSASRNNLEQYTQNLKGSRNLLSRASSNTRSAPGLAMVPGNGLPVLHCLYSKHLKHIS